MSDALKDITAAQRGATMLEVSLTIALFFAFLAMFLWLGITLNARTGLTTSMGSGLHYGVTRGDPRGFGGVGANTDLETYRSAGGCPPAGSIGYNASHLLYRRGQSDAESVDTFVGGAPEAYALKHLGPTYGCFTDLPRQYLYSLAAVHQYMRTRVGAGILNYPCDDRPGCLGCKFLNPDSVGDTTVDPYSAPTSPVSGDLINMECVYIPDYKGLNPLLSGLMGDSGKNFQIRRQFYVNRARDR